MLIFDEVVTGFRLAYGGAQEALWRGSRSLHPRQDHRRRFSARRHRGASAEIMAHFDKDAVGADRWLMQLGTLSGNPVAAVAGLKTMEILRRDGQYARLRALGRRVMGMAASALEAHGIAHRIVGDATLFDVVFTDADVRDYRDTFRADAARNAAINATLRREGIFKSPGKIYPCLALTDEDLAQTAQAYRTAARALATD